MDAKAKDTGNGSVAKSRRQVRWRVEQSSQWEKVTSQRMATTRLGARQGSNNSGGQQACCMIILACDLAIRTGSPRGCFDEWVESRASRAMSAADLLRNLAYSVHTCWIGSVGDTLRASSRLLREAKSSIGEWAVTLRLQPQLAGTALAKGLPGCVSESRLDSCALLRRAEVGASQRAGRARPASNSKHP